MDYNYVFITERFNQYITDDSEHFQLLLTQIGIFLTLWAKNASIPRHKTELHAFWPEKRSGDNNRGGW